MSLQQTTKKGNLTEVEEKTMDLIFNEIDQLMRIQHNVVRCDWSPDRLYYETKDGLQIEIIVNDKTQNKVTKRKK